MRGLARRAGDLFASTRPAEVNGQPGLLAFDADGHLVGVLAFDLLDGRTSSGTSVRRPRPSSGPGDRLVGEPAKDLASAYGHRFH
jgi:hypothetical protein